MRFKRTGSVFVILAVILTPAAVAAQTNSSAAEIAAALLPLPETMRGDATVVGMVDGKISVLRKGSNGMVCAHNRSIPNVFWAQCFHETIIPLMNRADQMAAELRASGKAPTEKAINDVIDSEIKAGKLKVPEHPTMGFQMRGPADAYDPTTQTVKDGIESWQMVIVPYATGKTFSLNERPSKPMPWVMNAGTWLAHIMIQH